VNSAVILSLDADKKWLISGFAIILFPELRTPAVARKPSVLRNSIVAKAMCFHCHLSDLIELQRCQLLSDAQMSFLMEQTLRGEAEGKVHRCKQGVGDCSVLEFGL
jgi:hypothetical protein